MSFWHSIITPPLRWHIKNQSKKALPILDGELSLSGLIKPVKVYRDEWGVPHIYAENNSDLIKAQGFVHAQDRLFQMELTRRVAKGTLSEIVGKDALDTDRACRIFGFSRLAQSDWDETPGEIKSYIKDYVIGVNNLIDSQTHLPVEFKLLKFKPEKWTELDVMAIGRFMAFQMSYAWLGELTRAKLIEKIGKEKASELELRYPDDNPSGLDEVAEVNIIDNGILKAINGPYLKQISGSNSWVLSGERTDTGKPYLLNDPHLVLTQPAIWYENHLVCPEKEITGVSVPGLPLVLIGHNSQIGWGITLSFTDIQDIYVERFINDSTYMFKDEEKKAQIINEEIKIKDQQDYTEKVIVTHHGPVISDVIGAGNKKLALKSVCFEKLNILQAWKGINEAKGWDDFVSSVKEINAPGLNITYADTSGNIGYWVSGKVPIRNSFNGKLPCNGESGNNEWQGYVPFEQMPHTLNPKKGHVVTCNHKIIPDDYPYFLGDNWMNGYRAKRLEELLSINKQYNATELLSWQTDYKCLPAIQFIEFINKADINEDNKALVGLLSAWDGDMNIDSTAASIYEASKYFMFRLLLDDELGVDLTDELLGKSFNPIILTHCEFYGYDTVTLLRMLNNPEASLWIKDYGGINKLINDAFDSAKMFLSIRFGKNINNWNWGKLHQLRFSHPLSMQAPLDRIFDQGPIPIGGNTDTVCQTAVVAHNQWGQNMVAPSYRQLLDFSDWSKSKSVMPPGQSENLCSPYYSNQLLIWTKGELHPMLWEKDDVINESNHLLELLPEKH